MRRLLTALLLLAGCASSSGDGHQMRIVVIEVVRVNPQQFNRGDPLVHLLGPHDLRLRIKNESQHEITIHTIQIEPDARETYTDDPPQPVDRTITPGSSEEFGFILNVYAERNSAPPDNALDYVKLTLSCSDDENGFIETGSHSVSHQRLGG